jgi:hypothetical protein
MDILNFISWIKGKRQVNSVDPARTLLPVALKDGRRDDDYLTGAITVQDFTTQVASVIPSGAQGPAGPQGVPGPVGPAGLNWQGAWSALTAYVVDDAVGYAGASWFCIDPVGPSVTPPNADPTNWALLASQGATGPQGPQGIQGVAGPSGSGTPGTIQGQTNYWNTGTAQWIPSVGITNNGNTGFGATRVAIGLNGVNTTGYALRVVTDVAGLYTQQANAGYSLNNLLATLSTNASYGLTGNDFDPISNNSLYFAQNGNFAMRFLTNTNGGGGNRLIIQNNGQVVVGATAATNTDAKLVVKTGAFEVEDSAAGVILKSPDGSRWRITIDNAGVIVRTLMP